MISSIVFLFSTVRNTKSEYDPNPLLSLGKRKQKSNQSADRKDAEPSTSENCFGSHKDLNSDIHPREEKEANKLVSCCPSLIYALSSIGYCRERRRLKKLKKDKLRYHLSIQTSTDEQTQKRLKSRQKCSDELCKHRKHKKRRKHKKHHHRESGVSLEPPTHTADEYEFADVDESENGSTLKPNLISDESKTILSRPIVATSNLIKPTSARIKLTKINEKKLEKKSGANATFSIKDEGLTEEDVATSITEDSSGSSYVRNCDASQLM